MAANTARIGTDKGPQHNTKPRFVPNVKILTCNNGPASGNKKGGSGFTAKAKAYQASRLLHTPPGKPTLLDLPLDTRTRIFKYALHTTTIIRVPPYFNTAEANPPLLVVSRDVRAQTLLIFFGAINFLLVYGQRDSNANFARWTEQLGKHVGVLKRLVFVSRDTAVMVRVTLEEGKAAKMEVQYTIAAAAEHVEAIKQALEALLPKNGGFSLRELQAFFHTLSGEREERKNEWSVKVGEALKGSAMMGSGLGGLGES